jgi:hypothetical protein
MDDGLSDAGGGFLDAVSSAGGVFQSAVNNASGGLIGVFQQIVTMLMSSGSGGGGGGGGWIGAIVSAFAGSGGGGAAVAHSGGRVGGPMHRRFVHPMLFAGAQRYHNGGVAGLAPNEVPAILEKGEQVISARGAAAASKGVSSIRNVLVTDKNFVPDAMASSEGEKVILTYIKRNQAMLKQMFGGR